MASTVGKQRMRLVVRLAFFVVAFVGLPLAFLRYMSIGTFCFLDPFFGIQFLAIGVGAGLGFAATEALVLVGLSVGVLIALTLVLGRMFCSWICPFGTWFDGVGALNGEKRKLPDAYILNALQDTNIKYGLFVGFILSSAVFGGYVFCAICPIGGVARLVGPAFFGVPVLIVFPLILFLGFTYASYRYDARMWCKFYCPLGGFLAALDHLSWHRVQLPVTTCVECRKCENVCPMDIPLVEQTRYRFLQDGEVRAALCGDSCGLDPMVDKAYHFLPDDKKRVLDARARHYRVPPGECIRCYRCIETCTTAERVAQRESLLAPEARKRVFDEVSKGLTQEQAVSEADRCLNCQDEPCRLACPANIDVPRYVKLIREHDFRGSLECIIESAPMPGTLGRVCPAPCEGVCRRGRDGEPIRIRLLKRFVSDVFIDARSDIHHAPPTGKRVAIVGSGPAGLTVAYRLALLGHEVDVFEELPVLGGMLRVGIPAYRLPPAKLEKEVNWIRDQGVRFHPGVSIGKDRALQDLIKAHDAVLLAIGAHRPKELGLEGEESIKGVMSATDFLRKVNLGQEVVVGRRVGVVGGGNVAMDCVRTAVRLGAQKVYCIYRRSFEEMPANKVEVKEAQEEGVEFMLLHNPTKLYQEDGALSGVQLIKMSLGEPDSSGRRRPEPIKGSEYDVGLDWIIPAISQEPILDWLPDELGVALTRWGTFKVDTKTYMTSLPGVFACGDDEQGPATVIEAIGAANKAAKAMHEHMMAPKKGK